MTGAIRRLATVALLAVPATAQAQVFDHSLFDGLLHKHVSRGVVDYDAFSRASEFEEYLVRLSRGSPDRLTSSEQLAYWINAYNAYTISLVNQHHERGSIQNLRATLGHSPWQEPIVKAGGRTYTLDQVEHEILRKRFREPRIHFAIVCAAVSCAPLRSEAYSGVRIEGQLDDQAKNFLLGRTKGSRVDVANGVVYVSKIFVWYKEDFGGDEASIGRFIARYYPDGPERHILQGGRFKLAEFEYDWSLNSPPRPSGGF